MIVDGNVTKTPNMVNTLNLTTAQVPTAVGETSMTATGENGPVDLAPSGSIERVPTAVMLAERSEKFTWLNLKCW